MRRHASIIAIITLSAAPTLAKPTDDAVIDHTIAPYASVADSVTLADGRKIHFVCMGRGSPTVILTAGLGDWGTSWSTVQPAIAKTTSACAWDRPGFGLSDAGSQPQSSATTTSDLEAALAQGSIRGPYVLVGHSLGSCESLLYADRHPNLVAGMVLVDPTVPDQAAMMKRVAPVLAESSDSYTKGLVALVRGCAAQLRSAGSVDRRSSPDCDIPVPATYPPEIVRLLKAEAAKPAQGEAIASFYENAGLSGEEVINPKRTYADMPLIVLTATEAAPPPPGVSPEVAAQAPIYLEAFAREHDKLAALSTRGINARVPGTTHYIHQIKPQIVIDAVNQVVAEARAAGR